MSWHVCDALPISSPRCTCNYVFLQCVHAAATRRYVPRSCRSVPRTVKLFVPRQMEAGCLVSGSEDISSLFPEQTPGAKYKVGFSLRVCGGLLQVFTCFHVLLLTRVVLLLGSEQPVLLRETSAWGWELLLQSPLLRTLGVDPAQCQGFTEVSHNHCYRSSKNGSRL